MLTTILLLAQLQTPPGSEPVRIVRGIQVEIDRSGGRELERTWRTTLSRAPTDARAVLAVATFERNRYRYERADSLLLVLGAMPGASDAWRAVSLIGRATWRALGTDVPTADSLLMAARALAHSAPAPDIEAEALLVLMQVRQRTQGPQAGRRLHAEWWALLPAPTAQDSALSFCQLGAIDDQTGDTSGARRVMHGAELAERRESWRVAGNCRLSLAQIADRRGFAGASRPAARKALEHFTRIDYTLGIALASQWLGYVEVNSHAYASGKLLLEQAIDAARTTRFESVEGWAYSGLAQMYLDLGDLTRARRYASMAAASHERRHDLWGLANSRRFEAASLEASGDFVGAVAAYRAAQQAYSAAKIPALAISSLVSRAALQVRLGWLDSAQRTIEEAAVVGRTSDAWRKTEEPELRGLLALHRNRLVEAESLFRSSAVAMNWRRGRQEVSAVVLAAREAQVALRQGRMALVDSAMGAVIRAIEAWRTRPINAGITSSLAQLGTNWSGLEEVYPDLVSQLVERNRVATAFDFVERLRARDVVERRLRTVALIRDSTLATRVLRPGRNEPALVNLGELQLSLANDEAFVSYVLGVDDAPTTAFVVTRDTVQLLRMPTRAVLLPDIVRFLHLAPSGVEATAAGRRLGAALLSPVFARLPTSITRIIVSPDGALHRVPFDALRMSDDRYAVERATFSIAPSATALIALRASPVSPGTRVVALGDPAYDTPQKTRVLTDGVERAGFLGATLPRLRYAGEEARRVAGFGIRSTLLLGSAATEPALTLAAAGDAAVVHVAAHGLVDAQSQFNTALAVAPGGGGDGFLTPAELSRLALNGPLVVLSACRSSAGQVFGGEGMRGLTAPLLEAGARAVVGTHWSIGDRSVVPFIERFYALMANGARPDDALRLAKVAAIRAGVSIAVWGSYTITGDGSVRPPLRRNSSGRALPWIRTATQSPRDTSSASPP